MRDILDDKIDDALQSINGLAKASPQPYLLTRINARINNATAETVWSQIAFYLKKPLVSGAAILLLLFLNFIVIKNINEHGEKENIAKSAASQKDDFAINVYVLYDVENLEP